MALGGFRVRLPSLFLLLVGSGTEVRRRKSVLTLGPSSNFRVLVYSVLLLSPFSGQTSHSEARVVWAKIRKPYVCPMVRTLLRNR